MGERCGPIPDARSRSSRPPATASPTTSTSSTRNPARCRISRSPETGPPGIRSIGRPTIGSFWSRNTCLPRRTTCTSSTWRPASGARWTASPTKVAISGAKFSRDGTGVYILSDRDSDNAKLRYLNIFTGEKNDISARSPWDVEAFALSNDGHYLAYVTNEGGLGKLDAGGPAERIRISRRRDCRSWASSESLGFDREGKRLVFGLSAANQPRDAYVLDIESNRVEAWTASEAGPLDRTKFVVPHLSQFPTFDRADGKSREIPMYVYEPARPGPAPGARGAARGAGFAVSPGVRSLDRVRRERAGLRGGRTERPRLDRLREELLRAGQGDVARGRGQGRGRARGMARPRSQDSTPSTSWCRAATWRSPRS